MAVKSRQARFSETSESAEQFFFSTANFVQEFEEEEPAYSADSRKRDEWLLKFIKREPHLCGVISSVTAIDKNRGWRVVGGRNQVKRITDMLHNFEVSPGLRGWRPALASASESFWSTDIGAIIELGKESKHGPVRALYTMDPTKCKLTGKSDYPLIYTPANQKQVKFAEDDFFRVVSLPSLKDEYFGLGNCAVSRCVQLAQLMVALYRHEEERLLSRAPRGLLMLSGIKRDQWEKALQARDAELDQAGAQYFGAVAVLASAAGTVDAKLVALSELPANFNLKDWMDMIMYGYSLCFGYDPSEFWPVQYGSLGRGNETKIQHEKATGKGRLDFVLGFQEQLQNFMPDSIDFEFDQRDEQGDLIHASVHQAWSEVAKTLYTSANNGIPLLSREETRVILADYGIISSEWADAKYIDSTDSTEVAKDMEDIEEDPQDTGNYGTSPKPPKPGDDEGTNDVAASPSANLRPSYETRLMKMWKDKLRENEYVKRASEKYPDDEIVQYSYPANTTITLWNRGRDVFKREFYTVGEPVKRKVEETPPPLPKAIADTDRQFIFNINNNIPATIIPPSVAPVVNVNVPEQKTPIINLPEQKAPMVNVTVPTQDPPIFNFPEQQAPVVNISIPEQKTPVVNMSVPQQLAPVVNIPEQKIPVVNVNIPEQKTPTVTVNVPKQGAPVVNFKPPQDKPNIIFSPNITVPVPEVNVENTVIVPEIQEVDVKRGNDGRITKLIRKFTGSKS